MNFVFPCVRLCVCARERLGDREGPAFPEQGQQKEPDHHVQNVPFSVTVCQSRCRCQPVSVK
jgi:hypothetical protein